MEVDLVGINDFHGRIDAELRVTSDDDGTVRIGDEDASAAARLAAAVEEARAGNPDTFFVAAGDNYGASTSTSMAGDDIPTTDVFNAMELDVSSVGNHEIDQGFATLEARIAGTGDFAGHAIDWPYLGANVYAEDTGDPVLEEYEVLTTASDVDIAFIGLVTTETPSLVTPSGIAGLTFGDPTEAVDRVITGNTDVEDADAIVILTHDGAATPEGVEGTATHFGRFAHAMADRGDIAAIFSGHTHTKYQVDLGGMPVVQTGSFGENLGEITLTLDVDDSDAEPTYEFASAASGMVSLGGQAVPDANGVVDEVKTIVREAVGEAEVVGKEVIGNVSADLNRAVQSGVDPDTGEQEENRGGESTISNLIADAQIWAVHEQASTDNLPVVAFMNPGGVRTDIPYGEDGPVTYKQAATVQPFANTLNTFDLTGAQIKQVLEEQWQPDGSSRPFLKLGLCGLWYFYDPGAERDEHITYVEIDGQPLDETATYRVVANNFLSSGGDNFFTLGEGENYADSGLVDLEAFVDYFKAEDVVEPDYTQRAIGMHWNSDREGEYAVGEEASFDLSSLLFSTNEPKPDELVLQLGGPDADETIEVGTTPVDPTIVDTTDEGGRAEVRVSISKIDSLGTDPQLWELRVRDEVNDYSVWFELALTAAEEPTPTESPTESPRETEGLADTATPSPTETTTTPGGSMPDTGPDVNALVAAGVLLLLGGTTLMALRRRRSVMD